MGFHEAAAEVSPSISVSRWRFVTRLSFRFSVIYFLLFAGFIPIPLGVVSLVAERIFGVTVPLVVTGSGSGDKTYDWVRAFCALVIAAGATAVWSVLDRRRDNYDRLHRWFRLLVRFWLGYTMVGYGMFKVFPVQMPEPLLTQLLQPFGDFSPMGVLWSSIGASPAYERIIGAVEVVGAVLLFVPKTVLLGALITLATTLQVFIFNMTYDVPVKLFSFHLMLFSMVLIAPDARRLLNVLLMNRRADPSTQQPFGRTLRRRRVATVAQIAVGLLMTALAATRAWSRYGGGAPLPPLHGVWTVEEMAIDDVSRPPLLNDAARWRRVMFEKGGLIVIQGMDDRFVFNRGTVDTTSRTIKMTSSAGVGRAGQFAYTQPTADELTLDGDLHGRRITASLQLVDPESFLLRNRGFHWVQEYPFNR